MRIGATACRCLALVVACVCTPPAIAADDAVQFASLHRSSSAQQAVAAPIHAPDSLQPHHFKRAGFERERASRDARHIADWVIDSGDNRRMPFVIIDKTDAKVFVFEANGQLRGAAPALLGLSRGDDAVPGIGDRKLSSIRPDERTTPAGRFVAALGRNLHGEEILWVDYDTAVSLHRVLTTNPKERRAQRLATPTPLDNRISYGCINVPVDFFDRIIRTTFTGTNGIVYVLPETRSPSEVFGSYDVEERAQRQAIPVQVSPLASRH